MATLTASGGAVDDATLLAGIARGDRTSLVLLHDRHGQGLLRYLQALSGDAEVAQEILQDTFVAVWRDAGRFEGRSKPSTWLFGVARRQARNTLRRRRLPTVDDAALQAVADSAPGPDDYAMARLQAERIAAALDRLGPLHREVLLLAFDQQLSLSELAEVLDVPVGTVKSRLSNAKRQLRALLADVSVEDVDR